MTTDLRTRLRDLESQLDTLPPDQSLPLLGNYELLYRLTDPTLSRLNEVNARINDIVYGAFRDHRNDPALLHPLFSALHDTLTRRPERRFLGRPYDWYVAHLDRWHAQALRALRTADPRLLTPQIVAHLLRADLFPWQGRQESTFKRRLQALACTPACTSGVPA